MKQKTLLLLSAIVLTMFGFAYASVPLYRLFCQVTGYGGTPQITGELKSSPSAMGVQSWDELRGRESASFEPSIRVRLEGTISNNLPFQFQPLPPTSFDVQTGEPVLAFFKVSNTCQESRSGIATYNIVPQEAGVYFNKIQCFCFEEQQLAGNETIEMPVLFFVHPDILEGSHRNVTLSYTFFPSSTKL